LEKPRSSDEKIHQFGEIRVDPQNFTSTGENSLQLQNLRFIWENRDLLAEDIIHSRQVGFTRIKLKHFEKFECVFFTGNIRLTIRECKQEMGILLNCVEFTCLQFLMSNQLLQT
jgi:hypothetical protein